VSSPTPSPIEARIVEVSVPIKKVYNSIAEVKERMKEKIVAKWGLDQWINGAEPLFRNESGFNPTIRNRQTGEACGIPQAVPCSKLKCPLTFDIDAVECQIDWSISYIARNYIDPINAWRTWQTVRCIGFDRFGNCLGWKDRWY